MNKESILTVYFDDKLCRGFTSRSWETDELVEKWYGKYQNSRFILELVEIAYLLSQRKIILKNNDKVLRNIEELITNHGSCFERFFWPMLSVYKDLRERGRRVRVLEPFKFLVKDKSGELRLIYVLEEKLNINIDRLRSIVSDAVRNNLKATLAIVSLQGELTYYDLVHADLR